MEETLIKRVMPHSIEAEQSVIGAMVLDNESIALVENIITGEDFYHRQYGIIFDTMVELYEEGRPVDLLTLQSRLQEKEVPPEVSSMNYIGELIASVPRSANAKWYAEIVYEKSVLRRLIRANEEIANTCYAGKESLEDILADTEKTMFDILNRRQNSDYVPIQEVALNALEKIHKASRNKNPVTGIATGFTDLDYRTAGMQPSDLILIAARPSMGKTAFVLNVAQHVAFKQNLCTAIFSLEMSKEQLVNRLFAMESRVDAQALRTGSLNDDEWDRLVEGVNTVGRSKLIIDDTPGINVNMMKAKLRRLKDVKLVIIDYLQLMQSERHTDNRVQEVAEMTRALKLLAKEFACPIILCSQLSRSNEARSDKRPMLSDLRDSGAIEQDADIVIFLYRNDYYSKEEDAASGEAIVAECLVAKNRHGPTGTVNLIWQGKNFRFYTPEEKYDHVG